MKKILTIALSLLFIFAATASFSAAELPKESKDLSVIYTNNSDGITVPATDGKAVGQLPNGTDFAIENLPEKAVSVRVYPVQPEEKDVNKWIDSSLADELDAVITYYVACTDADGNEISNNGVKVTIAAPKTDEAITVYALGSDGKIQPLTATGNDGKITFAATGVQLYPFTVAAENPDTSDRSVPAFAAGIASVIALSAALFLAKRKRIAG